MRLSDWFAGLNHTKPFQDRTPAESLWPDSVKDVFLGQARTDWHLFQCFRYLLGHSQVKLAPAGMVTDAGFAPNG